MFSSWQKGRELVGPLLLSAALIPALYFNGIHIEYFALYAGLLFAALGLLARQWFKSGISIPNTSIALWLSLFWLWLGASLLWHPIPMVGLNYFWIVGTFPFAFWIYTLASDQQRLWQVSSAGVLLTGLALALWAVYQMLALGEAPRSVFLDINSHAAFLNLIALPASAYFLLQPADQRRALRLMGAALFVLFFAIMLTKGRGAITSFFISFLLLLWLVRSYVPVQRSRLLMLLALSAVLLSNLLWQGGVFDRLGSLASPASADLGRLQIWEQAWKMLQDAPWYGMGIGTFWLAWPPYRHPADGSGGYFAHNDYLQIWIEAGWPGLLLLLILLGSVAWTFVRVLRNPSTSPLPQKGEIPLLPLPLKGRDTPTSPLPLAGGEGRERGRVEMAG
ncbi:MAG: O-antigen ligase family protein, partial [Gammaproteobacteria bacterium]|nr:O-antigen ligase family protein [Gammaproteobacteria bacterium]